MNVKIKETGEIKELSIIDRNSGVDWISDLIGNAGAMNDGQFVWSEDDDAYIADQDDYDWWTQYIEDSEKTENEIEELARELDIDADIIRQRISQDVGNDYEDHRNEAVRAMNEIREEYA